MTELRSGSADRRATSANLHPRPGVVRLTPMQRLGATGGIAFIVLLLGLLTFDGIRKTRDARQVVMDTHQVIETAQATLQDLTNAETGQRGYLLTSKDRYLGPYHSALLAISSDTTMLQRLIGSDSQQRQQLDTLSARIAFKLAELDTTIRLKRSAHSDAAIAMVATDSGKNAMDDIRATLHAITNREQARLAESTTAAERRYRVVEAIVIGGTIAAVLIALLLNTLLTRFADSQADTAQRLDAQNIELADANHHLSEQ